ncbi:MAG: prephenate dehydrogenase/arogenate dehydrogenase family protein [Gammaproteobacteria bacterium]|nr:prephenate dehydrogenase/arogenate dehydrogenase family protein [Gammaproteobacteria bacterium]
MINRAAILGVGLIGGSLARALKRARFCGHIAGFGRSRASLRKAVELGVIDSFSTDAAKAVADADLVVLATPLATTEDLCRRMAAGLRGDAVITDVGSVKGSVVEAARAALDAEHFGNFVPGHPIAGTEKSGVEHSFPQLFDDHLVILTPVQETTVRSLELVKTMWGECGARVVLLPVDRHDQVLAATSHLPHMLAYALVDCLAAMQDREAIFQFAAGGFADFTRIASSSPKMWHDVCFSNRQQMLPVLDRFEEHLDRIRRAIREGDSGTLLEIFARAKQARDDFAGRRQGK